MPNLTLYSDRYLDVFYESNQKLIEFYWKKATTEMTEAEYRMVMSDLVDTFVAKSVVKKWQVSHLLLDNRDFLFTMSPKLQEWQANKIFKNVTELGVKKCAIIMSQDFVAQFSIEQTIEEDERTHMITKYFDSVDDARVWLT